MIKYFDFGNLFQLSRIEKEHFKTSLKIVSEVMNVPIYSLQNMLKANGFQEVEPNSICIDEEMLSIFANSYISKMKNYFLCSVRNIEKLSYQDITDLNEFYNKFKKTDVKFVRRAEWSQINTELIRETFMNKIKELTPKKKSLADYFVSQSVRILDILKFESQPVYKNINLALQKKVNFQERLLTRISQNIHYLTQRRVKKFSHSTIILLRKILISARYHIFVCDDENPMKRFCDSISNLLTAPIGYFTKCTYSVH